MARNFAALLEAAARRFGDKPVLRWDGGALTWTELASRASGFARVLAARGVRAGDRIAISIPNRWQFAVALLAGWKVGATVAPLDVRLTSEERAELLRDLGPAGLLEEVERVDGEYPAPDAAAGPALVLYTSGSTGRPKGAVLSHEALAFAIDSWKGPVMALRPEDVVLGVLPFAHSFGLNGALLAPLLTGATVAMAERFSADDVLDVVARRGVTVLPGVATMFRRLLDSPRLLSADLGRLRLAVSGAAPCPWELADEWRRRTGIRIVRGYGMTELFRPISYLAAEAEDRPDSIGRPVPGVEVRIVDDGGTPLPPGEVGELLIKTPAAMERYLNSPEETREVTDGAWFRTGDLASVTADGFVRIAGRKRERILRGGYSVFPQEVEAVLLGHPSVAEAAVVGVPHLELGEEVAAFVALRRGATCSAEELLAYCKARLAAFKYPRRVEFLDALPRGATGKVLKSRLPV